MKQWLDEADCDMKNYVDHGGCFLLKGWNGKTPVSSKLSDSRDGAWLKGKWQYERVIWEKGKMPGRKKEALPPQFSIVLLLCSRFLISDPTILEPETGD